MTAQNPEEIDDMHAEYLEGLLLSEPPSTPDMHAEYLDYLYCDQGDR